MCLVFEKIYIHIWILKNTQHIKISIFKRRRCLSSHLYDVIWHDVHVVEYSGYVEDISTSAIDQKARTTFCGSTHCDVHMI